MNENNKRIAKNTLLLYLRTFFTMAVGIYTSRVMLVALGINNYGIMNVVGGIVNFSALITGVMSGAISRYINYYLGISDLTKLRVVFSTSLKVQILLSIFVALLLEIGGLWFINSIANIPADRLYAANWVLQCSIVTMIISIINTPFNATIIAHENMSIYAYISIVDVVLKLGICYGVMYYGGDRLILYSLLLVLCSLLTSAFYILYSYKYFEEVRFNKDFDKSLLKEIASFSSWNLLNNTASIFSVQGINLLINVFFGVSFNAARGIANTVNGCVQAFVSNFTISFNPMITKSYAIGDYSYCYLLVNRASKFTWLMMLVFIIPITVEADTILELWLVDVPPLSSLFLILTLFETLVVQTGNTLYKLIQANGNIKRYSVEAALWAGLTFPLTWLSYKLGLPVWISSVIYIIIFFSLNLIRLRNLKKLTSYDIFSFVKQVLCPCFLVTILSYIFPILMVLFIPSSIWRFLLVVPVSIFSTVFFSYMIGLSFSEKAFCKKSLEEFVKKIFSK